VGGRNGKVRVGNKEGKKWKEGKDVKEKGEMKMGREGWKGGGRERKGKKGST